MVAMKVKCISKNPDIKLINKYLDFFAVAQDFHLTEGKEYLVLGIIVLKQDLILLEILSDFNHLVSAPIDLFEIIDNRISKFWVIDHDERLTTIRPQLFNRAYFHDDLFEGEDNLLNIEFDKLLHILKEEFI
jgi:hypothetical protein